MVRTVPHADTAPCAPPRIDVRDVAHPDSTGRADLLAHPATGAPVAVHHSMPPGTPDRPQFLDAPADIPELSFKLSHLAFQLLQPSLEARLHAFF